MNDKCRCSKALLTGFGILMLLAVPRAEAAPTTKESSKAVIKLDDLSRISSGVYEGKTITCYRKSSKVVYLGKLSKNGKTFNSEHLKFKNRISALKLKLKGSGSSQIAKKFKSQISKLKAADKAKKSICTGGAPNPPPGGAPPPPANAFESLEPVLRPLNPPDVRYFLEKAGFGYGNAESYLIGVGVNQGAQALAAEFMREKEEDSNVSFRVHDRLDNVLGNSATQTAINVDGARRALLDLTIFTKNPYRMRMVYLYLKMFPAHANFLNPNGNNQQQAPNQLDLWWDYYLLMRRYATFPDLPKLALYAQQHVMNLLSLDNNQNSATIPNVNLARTMLDSMTVGSYCFDDAGTRIRPYLDSRNGQDAQSDVNRVARRLTGWRIGVENPGNGSPNFWAAKFDPAEHALGPETIFEGAAYAFSAEEDRDLIPALYANHPCSAQNVARVILQEFVTPNPPLGLVRNFAALIKDNNFNLEAPMARLLASEAFYFAGYKNTITKTPLELMVEFIKTTGIESSVQAYYNANGTLATDRLVTTNASIDSYLLSLGWDVTKPQFWDSNNRIAWQNGTAVMRNVEYMSRLLSDALSNNIPGTNPPQRFTSHQTLIPSGPLGHDALVNHAAGLFGVTFNPAQLEQIYNYMRLQFAGNGSYVGYVDYDNQDDSHRQSKGLGAFLIAAAQPEFLLK